MPGVIVSILVSEGDEVRSGTELCVIETMKIQQTLRSSNQGKIMKIYIKESDHIKTGDKLFESTLKFDGGDGRIRTAE